MPRYIDAEILECKIDEMQDELLTNDDLLWDINKPYYAGLAMARGFLNDMPTADVQEVKHAKWVHYGEYAQCSNCEHVTEDYCIEGDNESGYYTVLPHYCSNCGRKMDLEDGK